MDIEIIAKTPARNSDHTPILFIHGAWHGAWCWEYFQSYFAAKGYGTYALSLRGHGASEGRARLRWYRAVDYVADVVQTVEQLPKRPILVGHSMGGYLIQKYLELYSVPGVVLLAPAPVGGCLKMFLRLGWRYPWQMAKCHLTCNSYSLIETPQLARDFFFSADMPEDILDRHFARLQDESYWVGWDMVVLNLPRSRITNPVPMLILGAVNDWIFSCDEVEATARAYDTQAEFFPDMAHDMMLENCWEKVAERVLAWLGEKGF